MQALSFTTPGSHDVQVVALRVQVLQVASQGIQLPLLKYLPAEQTRSQALLLRLLPCGHDVQLAEFASHVLQEESH